MSHYAQPTPNAPGRDAPAVTPPPAAPGQPSQGAPPEPAGQQGGAFPTWFLILPLVMVLMMVMTSRSQAKKQKQLESALKMGDRVITTTGFIGKIVHMGETRMKIEIAPGVNVEVLKSAIQGPDGGEPKPDDKKADDKKADDKKSDDKKADDKKADEKRA